MKLAALVLGTLVCLTTSLNAAIITYRGTRSGAKVASMINLSVTFSNLTAAHAAEHIHCCTAPPTAGAEAALFPGLASPTVHSSLLPAGEIHANLVAVPESASFALMGVALIGLVILRRRVKG